jgi:hypothetical protein
MSAVAKKRPDSKPTTGRTGSPLGISIDPAIRAAVDAFIESYNAEHDHRATLTSTVEAALRKYLQAAGFWPPKAN